MFELEYYDYWRDVLFTSDILFVVSDDDFKLGQFSWFGNKMAVTFVIFNISHVFHCYFS